MLRWNLLLGVLVWAGCGGGETHTYRVAPFLEPGFGPCVECFLALVMRAERVDLNPGTITHFFPTSFEEEGFTFQWGVEQVIEIETEEYDPGDVQDDLGVRFHFRGLVESHPVEPGARFEMPFHDFGLNGYPENFLVRDGAGFKLADRERIECDSAALCDQLGGRLLGIPPFSLELSYPTTPGGPLQLHAVKDLP